MFESIVIAICVIGIFFCLFLMNRNNYVRDYLLSVIRDERLPWEERERRYNSCPSYDKMLWQLNRWDWSDYWQEKKD